ncbi:hypothetical protein [Paraburkholderia domus]|uniref:hypothetical protein n=1 Tax=Paraburkholderia domus TaxID=2793075 RepID=UPI001913AD7D|nr:hypothetical protein [Paraburkholderia domus]MBK5066361.1 hypothetical protein [Burkholderia sp. R-70199]CAE6969643.1 hypothetical protein R70199_08096 [Paraburkholderia domus]
MRSQIATPHEQIRIVEQRLAETLQVFAAYSTINRCANKETSATLNAIVNLRGGFWHATAIAFQMHLFTGVCALVEVGPEVVTLGTIANRLNKERKGTVPSEILAVLEAVRDRYAKFRHTLFGHNGKDREILADRFDGHGFTWDMIAGDLASLEHAFKVLWRVCDGDPVPSAEESKNMRFPFAAAVERTSTDTRSLLNDLQSL